MNDEQQAKALTDALAAALKPVIKEALTEVLDLRAEAQKAVEKHLGAVDASDESFV